MIETREKREGRKEKGGQMKRGKEERRRAFFGRAGRGVEKDERQ
ncbi:hypothetical protein [Paenarthrobacter sp. TA1.8]